MMIEKNVGHFFDEKSKDYFQGYHGDGPASHSFRIRRERVYQMLGEDFSGKRVLDIGSGPGVMVEYLTAKGAEAHCLDISPEMIAECRHLFDEQKGLHFAVADVGSIPYKDESFDIIIAMGLMEYLFDDRPVLVEMARALKPGGTLIVTLPNQSSPYRLWSRLFYKPVTNTVKKIIKREIVKDVFHREYNVKRYRKMMDDVGLEVDDEVFYNFLLFLSPWERILPQQAARFAGRLEKCGRHPLWKHLGTGFILQARKAE